MWIRHAVVVFVIISIATGSPAQTTEDASFALNGTWIGWAWLGDAGDLPLRLHLAVSGGEVTATLDSPAHRMSRAPLEVESWEAPAIRVTGSSPKGSPISIEGIVRGTAIDGTIGWGEYSGQFELIRSPRPLTAIDPESNVSATGFYERQPGEVIELSARHWGELLYRELRTGRVRTLLPTGPDRFFIGSGIYDPQPVEAEIILKRDSTGKVISVEERISQGRSRVFQRVGMTEIPVSFESGSAIIRGTITRRAGNRPAPAVVMMGGSSWETRQDVSFRSRMLAALGFTVLSYDKRGFGESSGEQVVPFLTTAKDAVAAVEMLRERRDVLAGQIGILGVSRGGWYGPLAASLSEDVAFLILLVPPAVTPAEQETRSRLDQMRDAGFEPANIELARELLDATWQWLRSEDNWEEYSRLRSEAVAAGIPDYVLESDSRDESEWVWGRLNMFFDPCPVLRRLEIPILAIFGSADLYVNEQVNRARLEECAGKAALTVHTIEGAGHNLAIPNDLPIHRQTGRGDEGFSAIADWALREWKMKNEK